MDHRVIALRNMLRMYRFLNLLLVNKFLDYLILAFYMLFIRMIRLVAHAYRRRRIAVGGCPGNLRYITSSYNDLLAQEDPYGHPHHEHD